MVLLTACFVIQEGLLCQYLLKCCVYFSFSLNEYVNAGIEAVKITEETASPHHVTPLVATPKEAFVTPNVNSTKNENVGDFSYSGETTVSKNCKLSNEVQQPIESTGLATEDVRPAALSETNFIAASISSTKQPEQTIQEQFKPDHLNQDPFVSKQQDPFASEQPEQFVSTSLSEQFVPTSNLPSYEESQNIQDSSKNITGSTDFSRNNADSIETESSIHDDNDVEEEDDDDVDDVDEEDEDDLTSSETDDSASDAGDEKITDPEIGERTVDSVEFRTELSSVVPPTSISLEITASHETDTALPDVINDESSEIIAKEPVNHVENKDDNHPERNLLQHEHVDDCQPIEEYNASNDRFIKPITFETAATMDDVSDTELESYLQELEDLEDNPVSIKPKCDSVKSAIDSLKSEDIEPYVNDGIYNVDHTIEHVGELNQIATRDDRNADSFSQASTVEFGEVNATTSNEQLPIVNSDQIETDQLIESVQSKNVDSILDAEPTAEISDNHVVVCPQNDSTSELQDDGEKELSSDLEHQTECSECELDQQTTGVAKRPNSLNLQNCNTTMVDQQPHNPSNSVQNFSSDENAGNTPAACGQFLSSSISSDDSNIANDNNQMIVSDVSQYFFVSY